MRWCQARFLNPTLRAGITNRKHKLAEFNAAAGNSSMQISRSNYHLWLNSVSSMDTGCMSQGSEVNTKGRDFMKWPCATMALLLIVLGFDADCKFTTSTVTRCASEQELQ